MVIARCSFYLDGQQSREEVPAESGRQPHEHGQQHEVDYLRVD